MPSGPRAGTLFVVSGAVMIDEGKLSVVLGEFARTLTTDFPIQRILDHFVERTVEVLPVTAAGVTLIADDTAPRYVAASDASALRYERLQADLGEGPCILAYDGGAAVAVPDLAADVRFPRFAPAASQAGLAAVFTFPLQHGDGSLGALDLYCSTPGVLSPREMEAAQTLADVATAYLLNADARERARETHDLLRHIALHDPLTRLPNRLLLTQRLEHAAQRAERSKAGVAVLFLDLDEFKEINDRHGHHVGDDLLLAVADRLLALVRSGDTLARIAGDEFVFLCEDLHDVSEARQLATRIEEAFTEPFRLSSSELTITASVGVAFAGPGEAISDQLVIEADLAMYASKRERAPSHPAAHGRGATRNGNHAHLERDLRTALARDELAVAYQPIVDSSDGRVNGVEALLRWTHPQRGPISPPAIVALAEATELIDDLGAWILEQSCRDHQRWRHDHPLAPAMTLAVNVSACQMMRHGFYTTVEGVLDETGMDPNGLILEVTESVFIDDGARAQAVLADLGNLGIKLALDDFGTGFSSLNYLRTLPIDIIKVDQSFIADVAVDDSDRAIVAAVTNLAHVLGHTVTAEGVETGSQRDAIQAIGCEMAQGYFYSKPVPASSISAQMHDHAAGTWRLPPSGLRII